MLRAIRLVNAIQTGNTSGACLESLMTGDPGKCSDFSTMMVFPGQTCTIAASVTAMNTIFNSNTATCVAMTYPLMCCKFLCAVGQGGVAQAVTAYTNSTCAMCTLSCCPACFCKFLSAGGTSSFCSCFWASSNAVAAFSTSTCALNTYYYCHNILCCFLQGACQACWCASKFNLWFANPTSTVCTCWISYCNNCTNTKNYCTVFACPSIRGCLYPFQYVSAGGYNWYITQGNSYCCAGSYPPLCCQSSYSPPAGFVSCDFGNSWAPLCYNYCTGMSPWWSCCSFCFLQSYNGCTIGPAGTNCCTGGVTYVGNSGNQSVSLLFSGAYTACCFNVSAVTSPTTGSICGVGNTLTWAGFGFTGAYWFGFGSSSYLTCIACPVCPVQSAASCYCACGAIFFTNTCRYYWINQQWINDCTNACNANCNSPAWGYQTCCCAALAGNVCMTCSVGNVTFVIRASGPTMMTCDYCNWCCGTNTPCCFMSCIRHIAVLSNCNLIAWPCCGCIAAYSTNFGCTWSQITLPIGSGLCWWCMCVNGTCFGAIPLNCTCQGITSTISNYNTCWCTFCLPTCTCWALLPGPGTLYCYWGAIGYCDTTFCCLACVW